MQNQTYLMNPVSGSIDTRESWIELIRQWFKKESDVNAELATFITVVKNNMGKWVEVE